MTTNNSIVYAQNSEEKLEVNKKEYTSLLFTCNEIADRLELEIAENKIHIQNDSLMIMENEGLSYQLNNQKAYIKVLKKEKRKAWKNGLWQGGLIVGALAVIERIASANK